MQEIRSSNSPVVTGICDPNKCRARHHRKRLIDIKYRLSHIRHKTEWWGIRRCCITTMGQKWSHGIYQNPQRGNNVYISILFLSKRRNNDKSVKNHKICKFVCFFSQLWKVQILSVYSNTELKVSFKYSTLKHQIWNLLSTLSKKMLVNISILMSQV